MKTFFRTIHLYLGLAAGLVIMTCCFTGAVLVFEKELQEALHHKRYYVKPDTFHLAIGQLIRNVQQKYPAAKVVSVKIYSNPERSTEIGVSLTSKRDTEKRTRDKIEQGAKVKDVAHTTSASGAEKSSKIKQAPAQGAGGRASHTAFVNSYTGEVLELYSYRETFFYTMFSLHRWLLGSESSIGKTITGVSTLIFVFILITGIILWWPKNKAILKQRLKIKTNASWKRINHDLHIVLGFYSAIFLFIFAFTGLAWSFEWFNRAIYSVTNSSMKPVQPPHSTITANTGRISYDSAFISVLKIQPEAQYYMLRAPNDSSGVFTATVLRTGAHETATDNYYIDQYSSGLISGQKFEDRNLGQRVRSTFKPVHVGSIFGLTSKIIAFIVCVLGVMFPITGVIMWINRLRKKKNANAVAYQEALTDEGAL